MPRLLLLIALFLPTIVAAQTDAPKNCVSNLRLYASPEIVAPGGTITVTAIAIFPKTDVPLKFIWTVNKGEIVSGQGTTEIKIRASEDYNGLTATLRIEGMNADCVATASVTYECSDCSPSLPDESYDSYGKEHPNREKGRLSNYSRYFIENFSEPKNWTMLIDFCFESDSKQKYKDSRLKNVFQFLSEDRKIEPQRITFAVTECNHETYVLWIVSNRAKFTDVLPEKYELIEGETLAKKFTSPVKTQKLTNRKFRGRKRGV